MPIFFRTSGAALAFAFAIVGSTAHAVPVGSFTSFTVFGDSLSDPGNLYDDTSNTFPFIPVPPPFYFDDPLYFDGRVSNGPVWAEYVSDSFDAKGLGTENYAYAYARALPTGPIDPLGLGVDAFMIDVPDLGDQIGRFALDPDNLLGDRPLASLLFGANDIFFNGIPNLEPENVGIEASNAVADGALALSALGFNDFLIFNLPDIGSTPAFSLLRPEEKPLATEATEAFNENLAKRVGELRGSGLNVIDVDLYELFIDLIANPTDYGVNDVTHPCFYGFESFIDVCEGDLQQERAFFDPVHPNYVIHQQIAAQVGMRIAPVPIPAPVPLPAPALLLVAALGGLVAARRRS